MSRVFPSSEFLNQEEVDYELMVRGQPEDVFALDLAGKQRYLRQLFKDDLKESRSYLAPYSISVEAEHIIGRIDALEKALEKKVEAKYESRVLHYWYRVKWSKAIDQEEKKMKRDLSKRIESIMRHFQFGPPQSPVISQINRIIGDNSQEGAVGGEHTGEGESNGNGMKQYAETKSIGDEVSRNSGAVPKQLNPKFEVSREEWNEMRRLLAQLTLSVTNANQMNSENNSVKERISEVPHPFSFPPPLNKLQPPMNPTPRSPTQLRPQHTNVLPLGPRPTNHQKKPPVRPLNIYQGAEYDTSSEEETNRRPTKQSSYVPMNRHPRAEEPRSQRNCGLRDRRIVEASELDVTSEPVYENIRQRSSTRHPPVWHRSVCRHGHQNRVEKWKLRFSGDQRSMSVETFLYKAKKLAEREDVSRDLLLRDIHMLLDGPASDWFFTFVDELQTWEQFESSITYRFGNPNMDQGIRSRIQERKQLRGEPFIAFVSEIEKLDRLLSHPLSKRRKFEVIWDNMRQHYRSKISLMEVNDLRNLIRLNHRIDAADPQLQQQTGEMPIRRPVNQIAADYSDYESDQSASINAIGASNRNRDRNRHLYRREQQDAATHQGLTNQANTVNCWNCQERGHSWRQCQKPKVVFCYGCGNLGRIIRNCERCSRPTDGSNQNQGNE